MTRKQIVRIKNVSIAMFLFIGSIVSPINIQAKNKTQNVYAIEKTTGISEKNMLKEELEAAKAIDTSCMTKASTVFFKEVVDLAEQVYARSDAATEEIEKQRQLLSAVMEALREKPDPDMIFDGEYSISGKMWHASADQPSMGNASLVQPMKIIRKGDNVTLQMEFVPLSTGIFTGYLYKLYYFPNWKDDSSIPYSETPVELNVAEYYDGIYDSYNDPERGLDSKAKGKFYPHYMTMPVEWDDSEIWVQVYVPVMEAINTGSGLQYAKLLLDWDTLEQVSGTITDKSSLKERILNANDLLSELTNHTQAFSDTQISMLKAGIEAAEEVNEDMNVTQEEVNRTQKALNQAIHIFKEENVTEEDSSTSSVNRIGLQMMILAANGIVERDGYTTVSINNLRTAIQTAKAVYDNTEASQTAVDQQTEELAAAIIAMELQVPSEANSSTDADSSSEKKDDSDTISSANKKDITNEKSTSTKKNTKTEKLNIKKLDDGVYSIPGDMVKIDKKTASMSDEAINHTLKLTVKKGKYYITMDFKGLSINSQLGYLGKLKYFKTGYKLDKYGAPSGKLGTATVDSYQTDSDGTLIKDTYGTNYPNQVTFPLISEALEDGYVPLQVFVPIMEAISTGSGTQPVFLKLDLDMIKSTTSDDEAFQDNKTEKSSSASSSTTSSKSSNSLLTKKSTLPSADASLGNDTKDSKSLEDDILAENADSIEMDSSGASALPLNSDGTSVTSNILSVGADTAEEASKDTEQSNSTLETGSSSKEKSASKRSSISIGMSIIAGLAGLFYKVKGRNIFGRREE